MTPYQRYITNAPNFRFRYGEDTFNEIVNRYNEPHRYAHNFSHIEWIWDKIDYHYKDAKLPNNEIEILYVAALFHDVIYFPQNKDNEVKSANFFNSFFTEFKFSEEYDHKHYHDGIIPNEVREKSRKVINQIILDTEKHTPSHNSYETSDYFSLAFHFCSMDMNSVNSSIFTEVELNMFKEYQQYSIKDFKEGRIKFIESVNPIYLSQEEKDLRIAYLKNWKPNIGIFAGSFSPFHIGHLNALEKMEKVFDKVIILCAVNAEKSCNLESNVKGVKDVLPFHQVVGWTGLVTDYVKTIQSMGANVTICKGFRNDHDIPYEMNLYQFTKDLMPDISVAYFPCDIELSHISSSAIKNINKFGVDIDKYLVHKFGYFKKE